MPVNRGTERFASLSAVAQVIQNIFSQPAWPKTQVVAYAESADGTVWADGPTYNHAAPSILSRDILVRWTKPITNQ
jgi:hypothetical protein